MFRIAIAAASIAAAAITAFMASPVKAQGARVQIGTLRCSLSSSIGFVVGWERNVTCIFGADNAPDEGYEGRLNKIGLDLGFTTGGKIIWAVLGHTNRYEGMLSRRDGGAAGGGSV